MNWDITFSWRFFEKYLHLIWCLFRLLKMGFTPWETEIKVLIQAGSFRTRRVSWGCRVCGYVHGGHVSAWLLPSWFSSLCEICLALNKNVGALLRSARWGATLVSVGVLYSLVWVRRAVILYRWDSRVIASPLVKIQCKYLTGRGAGF